MQLQGRAPEIGPTTPVGIALGTVHIWLDSTRFRDAVAVLGYADSVVHHASDAPDGGSLVACYAIDGPSSLFLELESSYPDTSRVARAVLAIDRPDSGSKPSPRCGRLRTDGPVTNTLGLEPGMTRQRVAARLSRSPTFENAGEAQYVLAGSSVTDSGNRDWRVWLDLFYRDGNLASIDIQHGSIGEIVE